MTNRSVKRWVSRYVISPAVFGTTLGVTICYSAIFLHLVFEPFFKFLAKLGNQLCQVGIWN